MTLITSRIGQARLRPVFNGGGNRGSRIDHEGRFLLAGYPGGGIRTQCRRGIACQAIGPYGDQGEQPQQRWGSAEDGEIRPLTLGLDAKTSTNLLEGGFHAPARDEPTEDHRGCRRQIRAEECGRLVLSDRIAHQNPADRHRRDAGMVPDRGAGRDPQLALLGVVCPLGETTLVHTVFLLASTCTQRWQGDAPSAGCGHAGPPARRCRLIQGGIQPKPGDDADMTAHRGQQFQRDEAAVGNKDQQTVGQPAFGLQDGLPRPVGQRLVPFAMRLAPPRRWGGNGQKRQRPLLR